MPRSTKHFSVLFDTSFLITAYDKSRNSFMVANNYLKYFITNKSLMYVSSIAIAEYERKGTVEEVLAPYSYIPLDFTARDAIICAEFANISEAKDRSAQRDAVKDDVKQLAQACHHDINFVITDDKSSFAKYCISLRDLGKLETRVITLDYYDESYFRGGQRTLPI